MHSSQRICAGCAIMDFPCWTYRRSPVACRRETGSGPPIRHDTTMSLGLDDAGADKYVRVRHHGDSFVYRHDRHGDPDVVFSRHQASRSRRLDPVRIQRRHVASRAHLLPVDGHLDARLLHSVRRQLPVSAVRWNRPFCRQRQQSDFGRSDWRGAVWPRPCLAGRFLRHHGALRDIGNTDTHGSLQPMVRNLLLRFPNLLRLDAHSHRAVLRMDLGTDAPRTQDTVRRGATAAGKIETSWLSVEAARALGRPERKRRQLKSAMTPSGDWERQPA
ncbi:protein of unknown function [Candidatus Filomicrobium marinum]|uniref:Uncharacterized protein n=1 Tax=Candidatus Filomicrobium marinum TaxID=1608628 RepID=A0A0D6JE39_9HYPH|nr:protein of unknown function [Candidatus Filomicrobium marinum]CPR18158.1 protein of unknown function [Candidatus Filomicrobium marinum]